MSRGAPRHGAPAIPPLIGGSPLNVPATPSSAVNPNVLIFVQGVERSGDDWYWWGGNFIDARSARYNSTFRGALVYSPHDYGPGVYSAVVVQRARLSRQPAGDLERALGLPRGWADRPSGAGRVRRPLRWR